jgi:hypothetical protein
MKRIKLFWKILIQKLRIIHIAVESMNKLNELVIVQKIKYSKS